MSRYCYQQTTYETCLSVALMLLVNIKPTQAKELAIWKAGWQFNFMIGQANYVCQTYNQKLRIYVENKTYLTALRKQKIASISLETQKIDVKLIDTLVKKSNKVIIYLDNYYLQATVHAPHFLLIQSQHNGKYQLADSWDGNLKWVSKKVIYHAIHSLRNALKFSPVLIYQEKQV